MKGAYAQPLLPSRMHRAMKNNFRRVRWMVDTRESQRIEATIVRLVEELSALDVCPTRCYHVNLLVSLFS